MLMSNFLLRNVSKNCLGLFQIAVHIHVKNQVNTDIYIYIYEIIGSFVKPIFFSILLMFSFMAILKSEQTSIIIIKLK